MWLWNVDISDGGELGYGLIEGQFTLSHDEGNYVTAFTATDALKKRQSKGKEKLFLFFFMARRK